MIYIDKGNKKAVLGIHLLNESNYHVYWNQGIHKNESLINIGNFSSVYYQGNGWVDALTRRILIMSKKDKVVQE